jgi:hypothetical protein
MGPSSHSIVPLQEIRTCREQLCRFLRRELLWWQCLTGTLIFEIYFTPRISGKPDYKGRIAVWHANVYLRRRSVHPSDPRHIALEAYCALTANCALTSNLTITASGLMDPKTITARSDECCQLSRARPDCDVCRSGDMIPLEERFFGAAYAPVTPPLPHWRKGLFNGRRFFNRYRDLFEQRLILIANHGKLKP